MDNVVDKPISVLLVESIPTDAERLLQMLSEATDPPIATVSVRATEEAVHRAAAEGFDVVLFDPFLPGTNPLDSFVRLQADIPVIPIVVIARSEDEALAVKMVRAGAQDYLVKGRLHGGRLRRAVRFAVNRNTVLRAIRDSRQLLQSQFEDLLKKSQGDSTHLGELLEDLGIAVRIQSHLLPKQVPVIDGYDIAAYYRSAKEVGGDYHDFIPIGPERVGMVVADVSGKSIPGLVGMTMFRSLLRQNARRSHRAKTPLMATNKQIAADLMLGMFISCCYVVLDHAKAHCHICSAGHNRPICWRKKTRSCDTVNAAGTVIGVDRGPLFDSVLQETRIELEPGDRLLVYSDGLTDVRSESGDLFGVDRVVDFTTAHADQSSQDFVDTLVKATEDFQGHSDQTDDITIVTFRYLGLRPPLLPAP